MTATIGSKAVRRRPVRHLLAFGALCALLAGVGAVSSAGASTAKVLGKTRHTPGPVCPRSTAAHPCEAIGSVTGFQLAANGEKRPFNVHRDGKLVAWAIDLSRPNKDDRNFFGTFFRNDKWGKSPTARIAVIKHREHRTYKLLRQGPVVKLGGLLGQKTIITLDKPLRVRKGNIVALTVPTWASAFANGLSAAGNQWRASRAHRKCSGRSDIKHGRPHQRIGSIRAYGCDYKTARLLYWAYYVPS